MAQPLQHPQAALVFGLGAEWAQRLFELTDAPERVLILRDISQLDNCGAAGTKLRSTASHIFGYSGVPDESDNDETFHAKIVLADGVAA